MSVNWKDNSHGIHLKAMKMKMFSILHTYNSIQQFSKYSIPWRLKMPHKCLIKLTILLDNFMVFSDTSSFFIQFIQKLRFFLIITLLTFFCVCTCSNVFSLEIHSFYLIGRGKILCNSIFCLFNILFAIIADGNVG